MQLLSLGDGLYICQSYFQQKKKKKKKEKNDKQQNYHQFVVCWICPESGKG